MDVATAAQPPSRHQKRYVPIVAGTLGGCGLALIIGYLFYLFLRRPRQRYRPRDPVRAEWYEPHTYAFCLGYDGSDTTLRSRDTRFEMTFDYAPSLRISEWHHSSRLSEESALDLGSGSPFNISLETGNAWDWDSNLDLLGLGALPFANVDFETNFDLDHQTSNVSTVPVSSDLESYREEDFPLDLDLELGNPVDRDLNAYLSGSRALPVASSDLQTTFAFDHQNSSLPDLPAESLPLPPAPTLHYPNCPRKFSSRARLE